LRTYVDALAALGRARASACGLPAEAARVVLPRCRRCLADPRDRQAPPAEPDALSRLHAERALLSRETAMLRSLTSTPTPGLR